MKLGNLLIVAALLLWAVPACDKNDSGGNKGSSDPSGEETAPNGTLNPGETPLLVLLGDKIEEYGKSSTVPLNHVFICGHRSNCFAGSQKKIPENSIPAIQEAIAQGVDMVELDVRVTSDGVPMLMHDETVTATTNGSGYIASKTFDAVRKLRMKYRGTSTTYKQNGQEIQVPTLVEALRACKDKLYVNLDVKACPVTTLMKAIQEAEMFNQVMVYGYSVSEKKECIEWAFNNELVSLAIHPYVSTPDECRNWINGYEGCAKLVQYDGATYYDYTIAGFGYKCHAMGFLSYSNSLNYDKEILSWYNNYYAKGQEGSCKVLDRFIESGSDFIQTDYFELVQLYLKTKELR